MAVDVSTQIVIDRPVAVVADYAANPDNVPYWYVNIQSVEWKTPKPLAVGSQVAFVAKFLGRRMAYTYEIVSLVPGQQVIMRTSQGPFPMETQYRWEPSGAGTRMTLRNVGNPGGFFKLAAPLMARAMRKANQKDLASLKRILEATEFR
jgi:uncharacterized membrane protein